MPLSPADLGLPVVAKPAPDGAQETAPRPAPLAPGSVTAQALLRVWSGEAVTVVDSPPGAGKTRLATTVVAHLALRAGLRVLVATPTKAQALSFVHRLVAQVPTKEIEVWLSGLEPGVLPKGLANEKRTSRLAASKVTVRSLASCAFKPPEGFDVLVVDEAYQATFADVSLAAERIPQVLLIGDPGQIGPVVTVDVSVWESVRLAPHRRAPEAFRLLDGAETLPLRSTWRLGPVSAKAVAPLYDFEFASVAADRQVRLYGAAGGVAEIETVQVRQHFDPDHLEVAGAVVERVATLLGSDEAPTTLLAQPDPDGPEGATCARRAGPADVAVVLSRNSQCSIVSGMLSAKGLDGVVVGTADRLQGGEWPLVVALDPAVGMADASDHALSLGRLCVMCSRHTTHLSWVHDDGWAAALAGNTPARRKARAVRQRLVACPPAAPGVRGSSTAAA